jgi:hypothetical protein
MLLHLERSAATPSASTYRTIVLLVSPDRPLPAGTCLRHGVLCHVQPARQLRDRDLRRLELGANQ